MRLPGKSRAIERGLEALIGPLQAPGNATIRIVRRI